MGAINWSVNQVNRMFPEVLLFILDIEGAGSAYL